MGGAARGILFLLLLLLLVLLAVCCGPALAARHVSGGGETADEPEPSARFPAAVVRDSEKLKVDYGRFKTVPAVTMYSSLLPRQYSSFVEVVGEELQKAAVADAPRTTGLGRLARNPLTTLLDVTGHVGVEAVTLATEFGLRGTVVEIDPGRAALLEENVKEFKVPLTVEVGDGAAAIRGLAQRPRAEVPDVVYMDPPWGGPGYKKKAKTSLTLGDASAGTLARDALGAGVRLVVLKAPLNYDEADLRRKEARVTRRVVTTHQKRRTRPSFALYFIRPA